MPEFSGRRGSTMRAGHSRAATPISGAACASYMMPRQVVKRSLVIRGRRRLGFTPAAAGLLRQGPGRHVRHFTDILRALLTRADIEDPAVIACGAAKPGVPLILPPARVRARSTGSRVAEETDFRVRLCRRRRAVLGPRTSRHPRKLAANPGNAPDQPASRYGEGDPRGSQRRSAREPSSPTRHYADR